jgi:hypothetical protein
VEVRFGAERLAALPDFMSLFRQAEERVQALHPGLRAEAIGYLEVSDNAERIRAEENKLDRCVQAARDGLGGVDLLVRPYDAIRICGGPPIVGPSAPHLLGWASRSMSASSPRPVSPPPFARPVCGVSATARTLPTTRISWTSAPVAE